MEPQGDDATATALLNAGLHRQELPDWFYVPGWKLAPCSTAARNDVASRQKRWLLFNGQLGFGDRLARRLRELSRRSSSSPREKNPSGARQAITLRSQTRSDFDVVLNDLHRDGRPPDVIVHLGLRIRTAGRGQSSAGFDHLQDVGFYSLLGLAQSLGSQNATHPVRIGVVSSQIHAVTGDEALCPPKATVLGLRVIRRSIRTSAVKASTWFCPRVTPLPSIVCTINSYSS